MRPPVTTGTPEKSVCEPNRILEHFGAARWKILCDLDRTRRVGLTTKSLETVCTGFMKRPGLSVPRRAVMGAAGNGPDGARLRALIVILCRAGLRIGEALDLAETDLEAARGAVLVRKGKGGRRREVGMDTWACQQLQSCLRREASSRSGRGGASSTVQPLAGIGNNSLPGSNYDGQQAWRGCIDASRRAALNKELLTRYEPRAPADGLGSCCYHPSLPQPGLMWPRAVRCVRGRRSGLLMTRASSAPRRPLHLPALGVRAQGQAHVSVRGPR
jgi:hypothetical protein